MINFILQTVNGVVRHDFVLEMLNAIEYYNWREPNSMSYIFRDLKDIKHGIYIGDFIPIGTVEFVHSYIDYHIKKHGSDKLNPINVPDELMDYEYTGRWIENIDLGLNISNEQFIDTLKECCKTKDIFVKDRNTIKHSSNGFYNTTTCSHYLEPGQYQFSETINIVSEYRCFVYKNELKGVQYYSGDFSKYPNVDRIHEMIDVYSETAPQAYTLDVAVINDNKTVVIEVHDFYSCGLYGFNDLQALPYMFKRTFDNIKNKIKNQEYDRRITKTK